MKNEKGITLVALVITVLLIMILISVTTENGVSSYRNMKVKNFVAKMKTVQEAVDKLCDKYSVQEINKMGADVSSLDVDDAERGVLIDFIGNSSGLNSWYESAGDNVTANYRYFSEDQISSILGIKDFDTPIFFNPKTRNVIAVKGVRYEKKMYYRQYDLPDGQTLLEPKIDTNFKLDVSVKTFDNKAIVYINKTKDDSDNDIDIDITALKYSKKNSAGDYGSAIISQDLEKIIITESGEYKIEAESYGVVSKSAENINVTIVNKPLLVDGMTPVKYDESGNIEDTTADDEDWYNYGEQRWANAKLKDGSLYVWIPRYAYSIDSEIDSENEEINKINVEFMKNTSSVITTSGKALASDYKVIPAFEDGSTTGFANGEWDSELFGIWVAKYETTAQDVDGIVSPKNNILVHDEQSWTGITPFAALYVCRQMEGLTSEKYFSNTVSSASGTYSYGVYSSDTNNIDTHLMKNSEWGAVAYLSYSEYGRNGEIPACAESYYVDHWIGNDYSTTNNIYGIFGLSGGALEMVAAGKDIAGDDANFNSENKSTKYATYYGASNLNGDDNKIFGDAIKETSEWKSCNSVSSITGIFSRGGNKKDTGSGMFAYQNKDLTEEDSVSFRPVLIVEY